MSKTLIRSVLRSLCSHYLCALWLTRKRLPATVIGVAAICCAACSASPGNNVAAVEDLTRPYCLGPGDRIRLITYGEDSLTGEFTLSGAGTVALPLIGEVKAAGTTTSELQNKIALALRDGYLRDPKVSVEVLTYRPFYILGEVGKPGEYPYSDGLTVLNAVAKANGFTYRADTATVFIKRAADVRERQLDLSAQTPVEPGDTIRIAERYF